MRNSENNFRGNFSSSTLFNILLYSLLSSLCKHFDRTHVVLYVLRFFIFIVPFLQVVISTLPAQAGFVLPVSLLQVDSPPVIFDVVYKPAMTKLIEQVRELYIRSCHFENTGNTYLAQIFFSQIYFTMSRE